MATTRERGVLGEDFAVSKLISDGYTVIERNWRSSHYEIDIIAEKGDILAFVEVKTRAQNALGTPAEAVTKPQRRRIALAAVAYMKRRGIYLSGQLQPRFDIFEVVTERANSPAVTRFNHITGAYSTEGLHVFI